MPTVMAYSNDRFLWGWQALASSQEPIRGVKLLLDDEQSFRYNPSLRAKKLLISIGKDQLQVAADYVGKLIHHCQDILERRFGSSINDMSKIYVLTVPAVWSDKAKDATMKLAIKAGIPEAQLSLVSEPEAAALYTLKAIQPNIVKVNNLLNLLDVTECLLNELCKKKGDTFIVCDAGGGTVV